MPIILLQYNLSFGLIVIVRCVYVFVICQWPSPTSLEEQVRHQSAEFERLSGRSVQLYAKASLPGENCLQYCFYPNWHLFCSSGNHLLFGVPKNCTTTTSFYIIAVTVVCE